MNTQTTRTSNRQRRRHLLFAFCLLPFAFLSAACRQDMHDQPKYKPLRESVLFRDSRSSRPLVEGTVARGYLRDDSEYYTGKIGQGQSTGLMGTQPMGETGTTSDTQRTAAGLNPTGQQTQAGTPPSAAQPAAPAATGEFAGYTATFPFPIDKAALDRGQVRAGRYAQGVGVLRVDHRSPPQFTSKLRGRASRPRYHLA